MLHNFRTASRDAQTRTEALTALNNDLLRILDADGVDGIKADPTFTMRAAALVRESIADEFTLQDPTPIFLNRREARLGDKVEFTKKHRALRVVKYAPQSQPLIFSPVKSKYTVSTSMWELPYGIELFKILTRQYEVADLVEDAASAMVRHRVELVLTAMNVACGVGAVDIRGRSLRTMSGQADVQKADLDAALRRMGPNVTVYGSRFALDPIFTFGANSAGDATKEEYLKRGQIGTYRGARLVAVEDQFDTYRQSFTTISGLDWEKLIWISTAGGEKAGVLMERDLSPLNWSSVDAEKAIIRSSERMDHGTFIDKPHLAHVIQLA